MNKNYWRNFTGCKLMKSFIKEGTINIMQLNCFISYI